MMTKGYKMGVSPAGFTLLETLVSVAVFGLFAAVLYSAYVTQVQNTSREYGYARGTMEIEIARNILERDITMAGYGLPEDFSLMGTPPPAYVAPARAIASVSQVSDPSGSSGTAANKSDTLTLMGTALGLLSHTAQSWAASVGPGELPLTWDSMEKLQDGDRHIVMEPFTKQLVPNGASNIPFIFSSQMATGQVKGSLFYGLYGAANAADDANASLMPYYAVRYYLGSPSDADPAYCAPGTVSLLRAESQKSPTPNGGDPFFNCVLNMQVALGLDPNNDGTIDFWDNGGSAAGGLTVKTFKQQLRQVRLYILAQASQSAGGTDSPTSIRVGDADLGTGADINLDTTQKQEQYRWKLVTVSITPRNIR